MKILYISAEWHGDIVQCFSDRFLALCPQAEHLRVPGSLEIPLQAQNAATTGEYDAIVVCGFVVDGGIYRHEFVAKEILSACMRIQLETNVPIIYAVLTPHHFQETDFHTQLFSSHFIQKADEAFYALQQTLLLQKKWNQ